MGGEFARKDWSGYKRGIFERSTRERERERERGEVKDSFVLSKINPKSL